MFTKALNWYKSIWFVNIITQNQAWENIKGCKHSVIRPHLIVFDDQYHHKPEKKKSKQKLIIIKAFTKKRSFIIQ